MKFIIEQLENRYLLTTLRIASWNTANGPDDLVEDNVFETVLSAIGSEPSNGFAGRINILALQETDLPGSGMNSIGRLEAIMESLYPGVSYGSVVSNLDGGGDATGFVFDESAVSLLGTEELIDGLTHNTMRAQFRPTGTLGSADFYAYTTHLKAGSSGSDESTRAAEANLIRADLDMLGTGTQAIVAGDFNIQDSSESPYVAFLSAGEGQLFDPINAPGDWHNNDAFRSIHTQNPADPALGGGGMDDRFDFQLITGEMTNGSGIDYIANSYRTFGNDGSHSLNGSITSGTGADANVLAALAIASDHLPVVADYEVLADSAGVVVFESGGNTRVVEGGDFDTYALSLNSVPLADVVVTVSPDSQTDVGSGPGAARDFTFTTANFDTPQTVIVSAVDDAIAEGIHTSTIVHSTSSADAEFNSLAVAAVGVTVVDDDAPTIVINEVDSDTEGVDQLEFVELFDGGVGDVDLSGYSVVFFNGNTDASYAAFDLDGVATQSNGFLVLGNAAVSPDITFGNSVLQNGADAVALYRDDAANFPNGTPVTTTNLVDAVVYDTDDGDDLGLLSLILDGQPQVNENENNNRAFDAIARVPDGGTQLVTSGFQVQSPTPGDFNVAVPVTVIVTQSGGSTNVVEGGAGDSYSIALSSLPSRDVSIVVTPDDQIDLGSGAGIPVTLTFSPITGTIPQSVSVTAVDDDAVEGPHAGLITHVASSMDPDYQGISVSNIVATIMDNEFVPEPEIVISEIMYNPDSDEASPGVAEWIELVNIGAAAVDLEGWQIDDEDTTNWGAIPSGVVLNPNQVAVLFDVDFVSASQFRESWSVPEAALVVGVTWGSLANSPSATSEIVTLIDQSGTVQDEVNYDDSGDWPSDNPDGASIYLLDTTSDNNIGTNWARSAVGVDDAINPGLPFTNVDEGSPGYVPAIEMMPDGDFDDDGDLDCDDIDALFAEVANGNNDASFDFTGDGVVTELDIDDWVLNQKGTIPGDANLDFQVDISDFNLWNSSKFLFGTGWCQANFNADSGTDISDFNIWNNNKFTSAALVVAFDAQAEDDEREHRDSDSNSAGIDFAIEPTD